MKGKHNETEHLGFQVKQNKTDFISWLLTEFSENEFTNSEMKKHYDEVISKAIENASETTPVRFYIIRKIEKETIKAKENLARCSSDELLYMFKELKIVRLGVSQPLFFWYNRFIKRNKGVFKCSLLHKFYLLWS